MSKFPFISHRESIFQAAKKYSKQPVYRPNRPVYRCNRSVYRSEPQHKTGRYTGQTGRYTGIPGRYTGRNRHYGKIWIQIHIWPVPTGNRPNRTGKPVPEPGG